MHESKKRPRSYLIPAVAYLVLFGALATALLACGGGGGDSDSANTTPVVTPVTPPVVPPSGVLTGKIAFSSLGSGDPFRSLFTANIDGTGLSKLTSRDEANQPDWSPSGARIAFTYQDDSGSGIAVVNADGSGRAVLTNSVVSRSDYNPTFSPDGSKIAFASDREGTSAFAGDFEIYVMNADGSGRTRLTSNTVDESSPSWSPDGTKLAVFAFDGVGDAVNIVTVATGSQTTLVPGQGLGRIVRWSPDGAKIAYIRDPGLFVVSASGGTPQDITPAGLSLSFNGLSWSHDSKNLIVNAAQGSSVGMYTLNADGTGAAKVTLSGGSGDGGAPTWTKNAP